MIACRVCVSAAAACGLMLSLGCGTSRGSRDANVDRVGRSTIDVTDDRRDSALVPEGDANVSDAERDASAPPSDLAEDGHQDGPARNPATCSSYELAGPAKPVSKPFLPSVRVGNRYAVLSTSSTKADNLYAGTPHYSHDVRFSWFDPQTASHSEPVTPFRMRGYGDGGTPIDFGTATPAAIITAPHGFAVAWTAYLQGKTSLYFGLLDSAGEGMGQPAMVDTNVDRVGDLVWDGSQFAVLWATWGGPLRLSRIDRQGSFVGTTDVAPRSYLGPIHLFWDGTGYGVLWEDTMPTFNEVWFARVGLEGQVLLEPKLLTPSDRYAGNLLVEPLDDGYLAYWRERPQRDPWFEQPGLHELDRNGQAVAPFRSLEGQPCGVTALARSGDDLGIICAKDNGIGFASLGPYESSQLTSALAIGLPLPSREGVRVAWASAFVGRDDGFDVFWTGSLDGATWGDYLTQIRCAK